MRRTPAYGAQAPIVIDTAGGSGGGAGRFRGQLDEYLQDGGRRDVRHLGRSRSVGGRWLVEREWLARGARKVVAANNVSFAVVGRERWLLARNANHFLDQTTWDAVEHLHPRSFARQVHVVRGLARRADKIVAPSSSMANRIVSTLPDVSDRIVVRFHPLRVSSTADTPTPGVKVVLCPIVNSPFKRMDRHLLHLKRAIGDLDMRVVCTMTKAEVPQEVRTDSRFECAGILPREQLALLYAAASAIYYPTDIESFGYPLAEARAIGTPVVAQDSDHNREIAGTALFGYRPFEMETLRAAVEAALGSSVLPDPGPFDPRSYFDWLLA